MMVMSPRLAAKARSSAGTNTGKLSAIERLATPSTKQSATSNHGTKRLIVEFPSHDQALASAAPPRQVPRRGGLRELVPTREILAGRVLHLPDRAHPARS